MAIACTSAAAPVRRHGGTPPRTSQAAHPATQPVAASIAIVLQPGTRAPQATLTAVVRPARKRHRHRHGPRAIARSLLRNFRWGQGQFKYLNWLWGEESGWNRFAYNPYSGAYGIPQAAPGSEMASAGPGWQHSARTQITWGMRYIRQRYGSPGQAWRHECAFGWY